MSLRPDADLSPILAVRKVHFSDRSKVPSEKRLNEFVEDLEKVKRDLAKKMAPSWSEELLDAAEEKSDVFKIKSNFKYTHFVLFFHEKEQLKWHVKLKQGKSALRLILGHERRKDNSKISRSRHFLLLGSLEMKSTR